MPRCEGRPNVSCTRNDNSVRSTQGDLFLCPDCEEFRFPSKGRTASNTVRPAKAPVESTAACGKSKTVTRSASKKATDDKTEDVGASQDTSQNFTCSSCVSTIHSDSAKVCCAVCDGQFHFACTGVQENLRSPFLEIVNKIGWVCEACQCRARSTIHKIQSEISALSETVAKLEVDMTKMKAASHSDFVPGVKMNEDIKMSRSAEAPAQLTTETEIHRILNDVNRRKSNVIVSGLAESYGGQENCDADAFLALCENHLHCKPYVVSCVRLGQRMPNKPRRLLVRLREESSATELLKVSRQLRRDPDSSSVYINPDLTPAAAKLAYEERQRRRHQRLFRSGNNQQKATVPSNTVDTSSTLGAALNPEALPFQA